jgi:hypothetical protein
MKKRIQTFEKSLEIFKVYENSGRMRKVDANAAKEKVFEAAE